MEYHKKKYFTICLTLFHPDFDRRLWPVPDLQTPFSGDARGLSHDALTADRDFHPALRISYPIL
jgi:hypothetical protein